MDRPMSIIGGLDMYSWPLERYESSKPPYGRKVRFLNKNGWDGEPEFARQFFNEGDILNVAEIYVGRSSSDVEFVELLGRKFNTVMFADVEESV